VKTPYFEEVMASEPGYERRTNVNEKACYRCGYHFKASDAIVHRAYGDYHERCWREILVPGPRIRGVQLALIALCLTFAACATAPVQHAKHYLNGCTAALSHATGSIFYERVVVVGITPQGSTYWVYYPDRRSEPKEGRKAYAEAMPVEQFIERGKLGHAGGRPCRCPSELWGVSSGISADQ
jgi:hypothetical protein